MGGIENWSNRVLPLLRSPDHTGESESFLLRDVFEEAQSITNLEREITMRRYFGMLVVCAALSAFALAQSQQPPQSTPPTLPQGSSTGSQAPDQQAPAAQNPSSTNPADTQKPADTDKDKDKDKGKMPQSDASASDTSSLQSSIQSAIQQDPSLANANVDVKVTEKNVELSGTVPSDDAKKAAERIAKSNAGGRKVKDKLKVAKADTDKDKQPNQSNPKPY